MFALEKKNWKWTACSEITKDIAHKKCVLSNDSINS